MKDYYDESLSYRDYVVHIFTGILFNLFLLAAVWTILPPNWWEYELHNEILLLLIAIPVFFLEGHFILAIDRFLFMEFFSWLLHLINRKIRKKQDIKEEEQSDEDESSSNKKEREELYGKCEKFFYLLFAKRVIGQKIILKVDKKKKLEKTPANICRYDMLSDFFKGVGCAAWIALFMALFVCNWCIAGCMLAVIVLSWLRCRYYSWLYVKNAYSEKIS